MLRSLQEISSEVAFHVLRKRIDTDTADLSLFFDSTSIADIGSDIGLDVLRKTMCVGPKLHAPQIMSIKFTKEE